MKQLPLDIFVTYFSAYSAHTIEDGGVVYPTVEHAYHCRRYDDAGIRSDILAARSPRLAWEVSQRYKAKQIAGFADHKATVMEALFRLKLAQHADVREALVRETDGYQIVKHITTGSPADGYWDDGVDGRGQNVVGKIWMKLREELRSDSLHIA